MCTNEREIRKNNNNYTQTKWTVRRFTYIRVEENTTDDDNNSNSNGGSNSNNNK